MKRKVLGGQIEPARIEESRSVAEAVYRRLRADIIWDVLKPDIRLRSSELCVTYGVGVSPLREALSRLVSERLVTLISQRGYRVAALTAEDVVDTLEARILVESEALQRSIRNGGVAWETEIVATMHTLNRLTKPRGPGPQAELWSNSHRAFHFALIGACDSPWLTSMCGLLYDQAERHRIAAVLFAGAPPMRGRPPEHDEIAKAAIDRKSDKAVAALERHYRQTADKVQAALRKMAARKAG